MNKIEFNNINWPDQNLNDEYGVTSTIRAILSYNNIVVNKIVNYVNNIYGNGDTDADIVVRSISPSGESIAINGAVLIGDSNNNISVSESGEMTMNGSATVFDDLTSDITRVKTIGTRVTINDAELTIDFTALATASDYAVLSYQMKHWWKIGSTIFPHVHWEQKSAAMPNMLIQYRWQIQDFQKTTAWTNYKLDVNSFDYASGTINQISHGAGIIPPAGCGLSDIIQFRVIRDTNNSTGLFGGADAYAGVLNISACDMHIELNSIGSTGEYTK